MWSDPQFNFDEFSALKIIHADEAGGYIFFVNMDNRDSSIMNCSKRSRRKGHW